MPITSHSISTYRFWCVRQAAFVSAGMMMVFSLKTAAAPSIVTQPQSQIITPGSTLALSVTATGTNPLGYQWKKGATNLLNQTNATLSFNNAQLSHAGTYSVMVSDVSGSVTSTIVTLGMGLNIQWQTNLGGDGDDYASIIRQTSDGGFIIGGHSGSGASGNKTNATFGSYDYWVVKLDSAGNKSWERSFGGAGNDYLYSLQQTSDNGFILGGISDSGVSGNKTSTNSGGYDYWLVKIDPSGGKIWEKSLGGTGDDFSYDLEQTPDNGFIVGGESNSSASGNKTNESFGGFDFWIVRLDSNGNNLWQRIFGGNNDDRFGNLQKASDGGFILGGNSLSGISGNKTSTNSGAYDYWVVKVNADGNKMWERTLDGSSTDDYRVVRLDALGEKLWDKTFGGDGTDILYTLDRASQGGYILGGYSTSEISGNKTGPAFGNGDYWMVGLGTNGVQLWDKSVGGDGTDVLCSLQQARDGGYILGGYSNSGVSGSKVNNTFGGYDYWVVKLVVVESASISGQPQSQTNAPGANLILSVTANNALGYQWRKNGEPILGANSSSLTRNNFQTNDVGAYDVVVAGANGDMISSIAYLFISGVETGPPSVSILSPKSNERITNNFNVTLAGTAKDKGIGVAQIFYRLNDGPLLLANGTTDWMAFLTLVPGPNRVEVHAVNFAGKSSISSRSFSEVIFSQFTLETTGVGTIVSTPGAFGTPINGAQLEVGRSYKVQAIPSINNVFSNWTGSATYADPTFNFIMESNMTLRANFVPNPLMGVAGSYNGLFQESNVTHRSAGFFTMKVKTNFFFSGRLILDGDAMSISGKFEIDGTITKVISRGKLGMPDLVLTLALDFANGTDRATGTVSSDGWTSLLQADRATFSAANPPTAYTNSYTMLIPGFANPANGPPGYGYGLVKVKPNGFVVLAGETADGIRTTQSVPLSKNGQWPFYVALYKSTRIYNYTNGSTITSAIDKAFYLGSSYGWVTFTPNAPDGKIRLVKTRWTNAVYANGFTNETTLIGARFSPVPLGTPAIDMTTGTITLAHGNLSGALIGNDVLIKGSGAATVTSANVIKFSLSPNTGLISGTFQHPDNGNVVTAFKGAVLQNQRTGGGHFLGPTQGGLIFLEEN